MKYKGMEVPELFLNEWKESYKNYPESWGEWEETEGCFEEFVLMSDFLEDLKGTMLEKETYDFIKHFWLEAFNDVRGYYLHDYVETEIIPGYLVTCLMADSDENSKYNTAEFIATKVNDNE